MPRVTVIMATYNWSTVLPYSIGSVLGQTFADFELLVIGDGCTDDSESVVRGIEDRRVHWIGIAGTGHQSGPNNEGLRQARGEIIAYLGHDDLWLPHHLAQHVAALEAGHDITCSLAMFIGPDGSFQECPRPDPQRGSFMVPSAFAHRRTMTERVGGWRDFRELSISPEGELLLRAFAAGQRYQQVTRLTVVKFPASIRRDVYRQRPFHEQAAWLKRIRTEPDLEAILLGDLVAYPSRRVVGVTGRLWRLLRQPSRWLAFIWRKNGAAIRAWQRFKGVDHARGSAKRHSVGEQ